MAYTHNIAQLMGELLKSKRVDSVLEFGDQVMCLPRKWKGNMEATKSFFWEPRGVHDYTCVDTNGQHGAIVQNCNKPFDLGRKWDMVTNVGFSEHLKKQPIVLENMRRHARVWLFHIVPALWFWKEDNMYWFYGINFFRHYANEIGATIWDEGILQLYKRNRDLVWVLMEVRNSHAPSQGWWDYGKELLRPVGYKITKRMICD